MQNYRWRILPLVLVLFAHPVWSATVVDETRAGVQCEPSNLDDVVDDRTVRVPADPSQPDVNPLPTQVLNVGSVALAPDVPGNTRLQVGYEPFVACRPGAKDERAPPPRANPLPQG